MGNRFAHVFGAIACIVLLVYLFSRGAVLWDAVSDSFRARQPWAGLAATTFLSMAAYAPLSLGWLYLLPIKPTWKNFLSSLAIVLLSQAGRYLPGNVGHLIGKVLITRNWLSLPAARVTMLAVLELMLCMICSFAIGAFGLTFLTQVVTPLAWIQIHAIWVLLSGFITTVLFISIRPVRRWLQNIPFPEPHNCLTAALAYGVNVLLGGVAVWLLVLDISPDDGVGFSIAILTYAIAWLAGFITPGAPAGLGVREFVFVLMLGPVTGEADALLAAGLLRLASLAGDILAFALGAWLRAMGHPYPIAPTHGLSP